MSDSEQVERRAQVSEARSLLERFDSDGVTARVLGGIGIALRCPSARNGSPLGRKYDDVDFVTDRRSAPTLSNAVEEAGYRPSRRFNAAHGRTRLLFIRDDGRHLDVFVDGFAMCHALPLSDRLTLDPETLSLADLLLTKLQIARLNRKDVLDVSALLVDHAVASDDSEINATYVASLLSTDWGWWRTVTENLETVERNVPQLGLSTSQVVVVRERVAQLTSLIEETSKSMKWRLRAKIGERVPWRDEPEEVSH